MAKPGDTEDLATLAKLDEDVLLDELQKRYENDKIYVSISLLMQPFLPASAFYSLQ